MKVIDLFSGIGGFTLGLTMAGHEVIGHCEIDKYAEKSYRAMHNTESEVFYATDITKIDPEDFPKCDIITGGFPCQDISLAGKLAGLSGNRSGLFFEIIRIIKGKKDKDKPRFIILENVRNLMSIEGGRGFTTILCEISKLGYDIEWGLCNSKDFGVPQSRQRIFIVGYLRGTTPPQTFPHGNTNNKTINELIGGRQGKRVYKEDGLSPTLTANGGGMGGKTGLYFIDLCNEDSKITDIARFITKSYSKGFTNRKGEKSGVIHLPKPILTPAKERVRQKGRRIKNENEDMFTLTATDRHGIIHKGSIRRLTPLECFRLQGFPDDYFYRAAAVNSDTRLYQQAGNAITVNIAYEIGMKIKELEDKERALKVA